MSETENLSIQICYRISPAIYKILEDLCFTEVKGKKVKVATISKYAREFMLRGMASYFEEQDMLEKYKEALEAEKRAGTS